MGNLFKKYINGHKRKPMDNLYGKTYPSESNKGGGSIKYKIVYSAKLNGYAIQKDIIPVRLRIASPEEYYRYLAGERRHLFPEFDPNTHIAYTEGNGADSGYLDVGVPVVLYKKGETVEDNRDIELPYGLYRIQETNDGTVLSHMKLETDRYIPIKKDLSSELYGNLKRFRGARELYEKEKVRHRQGVLLYGPPGNGKTREICRILENADTDKLIAIFIPSSFRLSALDPFREALEGKDIVFVIEEITERIARRDGVEELLSFLDGEMSWNHAYNIATTNYPEEIPSNIVDRPGRFDMVIEFGNPNEGERLAYLLGRDVPKEEADAVSKASEGLSLDYLAQAVTQSRAQGVSLVEYLKLIRKNRKKVSDSFQEPMGFRAASDDSPFAEIVRGLDP